MGIATHAVTLVRTSRIGSPVLLASAPLAGPGAQALDASLDRLLGDAPWRGWPVSFVLADELVRMWTVVPPPQAARIADLRASAAFRFEHLYGETSANWRITADWDATRPFVAAAVPQALHAAILRAAGARRLVVAAIEPHFVAAWNAWRASVPRGAWFLLLHGRVLALGITQGGRLVATRAAAVPDGADEAWLEAHIAREGLLLATPAPASVFLCGQLPSHWQPRQGWVVAPAAHEPATPDVRLALAGVCA